MLDCGSTILLFADAKFVENIRRAGANLLMETNAGTKLIRDKGKIPGYGNVWFDASVVSNLLSLLEIVKRGHRVTFDSDVANEFVVYTPDK